MRQGVILQEGEKVLVSLKPLRRWRKYFFLKNIVWSFIIVLLFCFAFPAIILGESSIVFLIIFLSLLVFYPIFFIFLTRNAYKYRHYWITNKRIIFKRGILGYTITSIPLERISDVKISRTFLERICGIASLRIESLAGQMGLEASLEAIPEPEKIQQLIFKVIKEKRKKEKITF